MPALAGSGFLRRADYPFAAVVGLNAAKRALLLLAIDPGLRGVLIASETGSAKSTLARGFSCLLSGDARMVELPLNVTEDRLLGGVDLDRTMAAGTRQISTGLLAQADGRVLYADDVNLLESNTTVHIAQALDLRQMRVEREGTGAIHAADFTFVGSFNPIEGEVSSLLRDRVALIVDSSPECRAGERAEVIDRNLRFENDPIEFVGGFALETAQLKGLVEGARVRLPRVRVSKKHVKQISMIAIELGVEGNRADVFAVKTARANAALNGRDAVDEEDIVIAIQLVLAPRATTAPWTGHEQQESLPPTDSDEDNREEGGNDEVDSNPDKIDELIVRAIDVSVPKDLLSPPKGAGGRSRTGGRIKASSSRRGRYVGSEIRRTPEARVAIDATLRAAAPSQSLRRLQEDLKRRGSTDGEATREPDTNIASIRRVKIKPCDLRYKRLKHRSGILFIFAVDASGSMAVNRMAQAKGALTRLLGQAYLHRDKVALISFRGEASQLLLAPTRSVDLAKRLVDALPAGGGTPLSAGVVKAIELTRLARLLGTPQAKLVLFTDGRANVGLREGRADRTTLAIGDELRKLGGLLASEEINSVVVDTKSRFISSGEGEALARTLGARYFYLPRSDAEAVYNAITSGTRRRVKY